MGLGFRVRGSRGSGFQGFGRREVFRGTSVALLLGKLVGRSFSQGLVWRFRECGIWACSRLACKSMCRYMGGDSEAKYLPAVLMLRES